MQPIVHLLSVAGSSSQCARCTAMSKRTKEQCGRPALKASKTQKCQFHGGRGSGPKTAEGRQRVAQAHTVHGRETRQIRQERTQSALRLSIPQKGHAPTSVTRRRHPKHSTHAQHQCRKPSQHRWWAHPERKVHCHIQ